MVEPAKNKWRVHPDVFKLGIVSFLTDLSSEMIFSIFAVFFTKIAGASAALLGFVEGLADLSASSLDYFSGWLSDRTGKHKIFVIAGYGFSTLAKVILLFSSSIVNLGLFRVIERLGKSFRGPPRDAWLSRVAEKERGYAFGVHKALDKAGAVLGPLVAYGILSWLGEIASTFRILFWVALIPAVFSLVVLARMKEEPAVRNQSVNIFETWKNLGLQFKRYLVSVGVFSLAYFSFGFLLLRAYSVGFAVKDIVLLYALFNIATVVFAPLGGILSDRIGRGRVIMLGYLIYLLMCLGFVYADKQWQVIVLFIIYGVFLAFDEAQGKAFIADLEPERRATAIGLYNFVSGLIYFPASLIAGALWLYQPNSAFLVAAGFAFAALTLFLFLRPDQKVET